MSKHTKGAEMAALGAYMEDVHTDSKGYTSENIGELIASVPTTVEPKTRTKTQDEAERLAEQEQIVRNGERSYVTVGTALKVIKDAKLWEGLGHTSFYDYCATAFDQDSTYIDRMIAGAITFKRMEPTGVILANEGQARAVRKVMDAPFAPADAGIAVIVEASVILTGKQTAKGITLTFADMQDLGVAVGRKKAPALAEALRRARDARAEAEAKAKENAKAERAKREAEAEALRAKNAEEAAAKPAPTPAPAPEPTEAPTAPVLSVVEGGEPAKVRGTYRTPADAAQFVDDLHMGVNDVAYGSAEAWLALPQFAQDNDYDLRAALLAAQENIKAALFALDKGIKSA